MCGRLKFPVFHRFMVETARLSGVEIRVASRVEAVAEDGASVRLANGQTVPADVVVSAAGLSCVVRHELLGGGVEEKRSTLRIFK